MILGGKEKKNVVPYYSLKLVKKKKSGSLSLTKKRCGSLFNTHQIMEEKKVSRLVRLHHICMSVCVTRNQSYRTLTNITIGGSHEHVRTQVETF